MRNLPSLGAVEATQAWQIVRATICFSEYVKRSQ
jgi:hypothetical protein